MKKILGYLSLSILLAIIHVTLIRSNGPEQLANTVYDVRAWVVPGATRVHSKFLFQSDHWPMNHEKMRLAISRQSVFKHKRGFHLNNLVRSFTRIFSLTNSERYQTQSQSRHSPRKNHNRFPPLRHANRRVPRPKIYYYRGSRKSRRNRASHVGRKTNRRQTPDQDPHRIAPLNVNLIKKFMDKIKANNAKYFNKLRDIAHSKQHCKGKKHC